MLWFIASFVSETLHGTDNRLHWLKRREAHRFIDNEVFLMDSMRRKSRVPTAPETDRETQKRRSIEVHFGRFFIRLRALQIRAQPRF